MMNPGGQGIFLGPTTQSRLGKIRWNIETKMNAAQCWRAIEIRNKSQEKYIIRSNGRTRRLSKNGCDDAEPSRGTKG